MARALFVVCALALAACKNEADPAAAGAPGSDSGIISANDGSTSPQARTPCIERPTDLSRPPSGALPCDMLPPNARK